MYCFVSQKAHALHILRQVAFGVLVAAQIQMDHQARAADAAAYAREAEATAAAAASTGISVDLSSCFLCWEGHAGAQAHSHVLTRCRS